MLWKTQTKNSAGKCFFSAQLAVVALILTTTTALADIQHRYSFNVDGQAEDSVGDADGTLMNGATVSGGLVTLAGGAAGQAGQHVALLADGANGINIAGYSALTVEIWATHNANTGNTWSRYFDIGSHNIIDQDPPNMDPAEGVNAGNSIFLTADAGGAAVAQRLAISNVDLSTIPSQSGFNNEQSTTFTGPEAAALVEHHVVATFDEALDTMTIYLDGLQLAQSTSISHTMSLLQDDGALGGLTDFALIGAALYPDPSWAGTFNEVRIYDMVASAVDVAHSRVRGPNGTPIIPEPTAAVLLLSGLVGACVVRRRR